MEARESQSNVNAAPPPSPDAWKTAPLTITAKAAEAARKQLTKRGTPAAMIRLGVKGGGCSGFSYVIEFEDDPPRENRDRVFEPAEGVKFVVDKKSMAYLAGSTLEWKQTLMSQGFEFVNPHEKSTCGCGHSFQV